MYIYVYDVYAPILLAPNSRGILADGGASYRACEAKINVTSPVTYRI